MIAFTTTTLLGSLFLSGSTEFPHVFQGMRVVRDPARLGVGLAFASSFFAVLLVHEMGHWFAARRHGLDATLPFFLPLPVGIGSAGAFIRVRDRFRNRRQLFDVGAAGPVAGFVVAVPLLLLGLSLSEPARSIPLEGTPVFGRTLLTWGLESFFPRLAATAIVDFHPVAWGAWFGLFITALNLLPLGQLDGGHVLYAVSPTAHRRLAIPGAITLVALAVATYQPIWAVWGILGLTPLRRHPSLPEPPEPLDRRRRILALVVAAIFALSFTPEPLLELVSS